MGVVGAMGKEQMEDPSRHLWAFSNLCSSAKRRPRVGPIGPRNVTKPSRASPAPLPALGRRVFFCVMPLLCIC